MKFTNKMINTTGGVLIRDEICGARRSHDDDNYHWTPLSVRVLVITKVSCNRLRAYTEYSNTYTRSILRKTLTRSLRTEKLCLVMCNESTFTSSRALMREVWKLTAQSKMDRCIRGNKRNIVCDESLNNLSIKRLYSCL